MSILGNRIYYINSENRISGSSSNFSYAIEIPEGQKIDTCCVLSMTIPRSYYLVRRNQNSVTLTTDGIAQSFQIPLGNYNAANFVTTLLGIINNLAVGTFAMTLSTITGKYSYTYSGTASAVSFGFPSPSMIGHQMGFDQGSVNSFVGGTLVSANVLDFVSTSTLFLHSDMVDDSTSILQEVYADNSQPFSNLVYNCRFPSMYSKKMQAVKSRIFNFSLTDENNLEVNLNGHDICVTLLLYKKEDLTKLFKTVFTPAT